MDNNWNLILRNSDLLAIVEKDMDIYKNSIEKSFSKRNQNIPTIDY